MRYTVSSAIHSEGLPGFVFSVSSLLLPPSMSANRSMPLMMNQAIKIPITITMLEMLINEFLTARLSCGIISVKNVCVFHCLIAPIRSVTARELIVRREGHVGDAHLH